MTDELEACPFCGQIAHVSDSYTDKKQTGCFYCVAFVDRDLWQSRPLEDALWKQLAERDALIERLVEAGEWAQDLLDDGDLRMDSDWHEGQKSQQKDWNSLTAEYRATVSRTESVGKESVE